MNSEYAQDFLTSESPYQVEGAANGWGRRSFETLLASRRFPDVFHR